MENIENKYEHISFYIFAAKKETLVFLVKKNIN